MLDSGNSMISIFHRGGNFISAIRGADRVFDEPGGFVFKAASGEFFVADTGNDLVQKFTAALIVGRADRDRGAGRAREER